MESDGRGDDVRDSAYIYYTSDLLQMSLDEQTTQGDKKKRPRRRNTNKNGAFSAFDGERKRVPSNIDDVVASGGPFVPNNHDSTQQRCTQSVYRKWGNSFLEGRPKPFETGGGRDIATVGSIFSFFIFSDAKQHSSPLD